MFLKRSYLTQSTRPTTIWKLSPPPSSLWETLKSRWIHYQWAHRCRVRSSRRDCYMVPLHWSPTFGTISSGSDVYRVLAISHQALAYIGKNGRDLCVQFRHFKRNTPSQLMPYDLHTNASSSGAWRDAAEYQFECSAAPIDIDASRRLGTRSSTTDSSLRTWIEVFWEMTA